MRLLFLPSSVDERDLVDLAQRRHALDGVQVLGAVAVLDLLVLCADPPEAARGGADEERRQRHAGLLHQPLGRRLADREKHIKIFGEPYTVKAEVATIGGLSGHAGQNLLVNYATGVKQTAKKVFLVHGEEKPAMMLTEKLKEHNMHEVYYPELHSSMEI